MTTEEVKQLIEQRTGVPASLLTGETVEENIAAAKALLAYKREHDKERTKSTREQFADWLAAQRGEDPPPDTAGAALAEIEAATRAYPSIRDGGEPDISGQDNRTGKEKFADWLYKQSAFDPSKEDGWRRWT